jgi:hypothetical protein
MEGSTRAAIDRTGQVWMATPWGLTRHVTGLRVSEEAGRFAGTGDAANPCLIVEPPGLGAAHSAHAAIDLVTGERCRLLEESDDSWEELIVALRREGALHLAPVRVA